MSEPTEPAPSSGESNLFGVSVRAWLALWLVGTVCASHLLVVIAVNVMAIITNNYDRIGTFCTIDEPLYSMGLIALGYFFGKATQPEKTK